MHTYTHSLVDSEQHESNCEGLLIQIVFNSKYHSKLHDLQLAESKDENHKNRGIIDTEDNCKL